MSDPIQASHPSALTSRAPKVSTIGCPVADEESLDALLNVPRWHPMPPDPKEASALRLKYRAKAVAIIEGWSANAPKLRMEPGERFHLRFLRFGPDQRFISTIAHHQIHRNNPEVCPRSTDPALGGDPGAECALCDSMELFRGSLRPRIVTSYWAYAVVLAGTFRDGGRRRFINRDGEDIGRPHRLRLGAGAAIQLKTVARQDPDIFDWNHGRDFVLSVSPSNQQTLRTLRRGPIQLTQDPQGQEHQRLSIESFLGEPHLYNPPERVMNPEERHWMLIQADARSRALSRLDGVPSQIDVIAGPRAVAKRQRRLDSITREFVRGYRNLQQPGWDQASSMNPQPARNRTGHLNHRLQTLLQYRDAMRRTSKAFWTQFDPH